MDTISPGSGPHSNRKERGAIAAQVSCFDLLVGLVVCFRSVSPVPTPLSPIATAGSLRLPLPAFRPLPRAPVDFPTWLLKLVVLPLRLLADNIVQACETCRNRKQRCDEQRPKCGTCQKFKLECRYREPQPTKYVQNASLSKHYGVGSRREAANTPWLSRRITPRSRRSPTPSQLSLT